MPIDMDISGDHWHTKNGDGYYLLKTPHGAEIYGKIAAILSYVEAEWGLIHGPDEVIDNLLADEPGEDEP